MKTENPGCRLEGPHENARALSCCCLPLAGVHSGGTDTSHENHEAELFRRRDDPRAIYLQRAERQSGAGHLRCSGGRKKSRADRRRPGRTGWNLEPLAGMEHCSDDGADCRKLHPPGSAAGALGFWIEKIPRPQPALGHAPVLFPAPCARHKIEPARRSRPPRARQGRARARAHDIRAHGPLQALPVG